MRDPKKKKFHRGKEAGDCERCNDAPIIRRWRRWRFCCLQFD